MKIIISNSLGDWFINVVLAIIALEALRQTLFTKAIELRYYNKLRNPLVIIIADHGSTRPGNSENWEKIKYHIPMIWLGGALNVQDTVIHNMASQTDLAATLLSQLDLKSDDFKFSKNILTTGYIPYAFFTYTGGFGFMKPGNLSIYNTVTNTFTGSLAINDSLSERQGKAYLQSLYMDVYNKNK